MPTCIATVGLSISDVTNSVISMTGSVAYLKAFIPVAITNIIHNRIEFDAKFFDQRKLNGVPYKTFNKCIPKKHPLFDVYHWTRSALIDLDKKYIKELFLIVRRKDTKDIIEHYSFLIKYTEVNGKPITKVVSDQIMVNTSKLFGSINLLGEQEKLNGEDINFAMQIILNDDVPETYVTKSFERSKPYIDPEIKDTISVGTISTGYHKLKILAKGKVFNVDDETMSHEYFENTEVYDRDTQLCDANDANEESDDNEKLIEVIDDEDFEITEVCRKLIDKKRKLTTVKNTKGKENKAVGKKRKVSNSTKKEKSKSNENNGNVIAELEIINSQTIEEPKKNATISCLCTVGYDFNKIGLVTCTKCGKNQHIACVGYRSTDSVRKPHVCFPCQQKTGAEIFDIRMYNTKSENMRFMIAFLRLVSVYYSNTGESPASIIDLLAVNTQQYAFNELLRYGVIDKKDGKITANQAKMSTTLNGVIFYNDIDSMELGT